MRVMSLGVKEGDRRVHCIDGSLESLQKEVGGYIQPAAPVELKIKSIEMLVNEEGLLAQLETNVNLFPFFFVGPVVFVGVKGEDFVSLTLPQIKFLHAWLSTLEG